MGGRAYKVTNADDGSILILGDAVNGRVGTWFVKTSCAANCVSDGTAGFFLMGRGYGAAMQADSFVPIPYKRGSLNNVAQDWAIVAGNAMIGDTALINVPANGMSIALLINCPLGQSFWVYSWPLNGTSAV
jgi:uncharacterized membrane protein